MEPAEQFFEHASRVRQYTALQLGEADTRAHLIDPVLRILGYHSVEDLRREVAVPATREFLDYQLLVDGAPQAIVEAKALRHPLQDLHVAQAVQYASVLGIRWCLITNGLAWALYDAHAKGDLSKKRVAEVRLDGDEDVVQQAWSVLSRFGRDALARMSPITPLLVERVVVDELSRPDSPAIEALRRAVSERFGEQVLGQAVVAAIARTAGQREAEAPISVPEVGEEGSGNADRIGRVTRGSGQARRTLDALVAAGLLPEDAPLEVRVRGVTRVARLRQGRIELGGVFYNSPSAASAAIRNVEAWNGWTDWRYKGETLADLRRKLESLTGTDEQMS